MISFDDGPHTEDGFSGQTKKITCKACGCPMISREYKFGRSLIWSTTHSDPECEELAYRISRNLPLPNRKKLAQLAADMD